MKNSIVLLTCCSLLVLTSCKEETPIMMGPKGPVEVEIATIKTKPVKLETELPGRITAYRVAEVRPQVNGIIQKRDFTEGSEVTVGELLYQIDPATYQARYNSAKAAMARTEAVEYSARLKAERYKSLVQTKSVSELDQIENEASWKQAVADVAAAEAELNSAKINLDYTRITAPISGVIGKSFITEGALVTAQQASALTMIQQLDPLYVDVTQSTTEMLRLKKKITAMNPEESETGKPAVGIILEDGSEYKHKGSLEFSDVTVDQSTGTVTVRAIIPNPDRELLPGMFVRAKLSNQVQNLIMIPSASLSRDLKGKPYVMVVNNESKVEAKFLITGQDMGEETLVLSGLKTGEKLVTAGLQNVKPGMEVTTVNKTDIPATDKTANQAGKGE